MPPRSARILFGYGYLRVGSPNWARPFAFSPTITQRDRHDRGAADEQPDHAGCGVARRAQAGAMRRMRWLGRDCSCSA